MIIGFFVGKKKPLLSESVSIFLIKFGIPLSVMGLILKAGIDVNLIKTASIAFFSIGLIILLINFLPFIKRFFPNFTLQIGGLIGNTSFLGIPIASTLIDANFLPSEAINLSIGFDLGTTLFAWIFGPLLLQKNFFQNQSFNFKKLLNALFNSPASKGIIGVLLVYLAGLEDILGNFLAIPTTIVINLALLVVGSRLGIITNNKNKLDELNQQVTKSIILKLFIFPLIIFLIIKLINFNSYQTTATVVQAATPSAISTILMAEAYKTNQIIASKILFISTLISIFSIPCLIFLLNYLF